MGLNAIWNYGNNAVNKGQDFNERTIRIDPRDLKALAQIVRKDPTADISDTKAILEDIGSKYQKKLDQIDSKRQSIVNSIKAINNSKPILSDLSSAAQNLRSSLGQNIFTNMKANGLPTGTSVEVSNIGAVTGQHTISVNTVASKQTVEIRSKDATGNAIPFTNAAPDVAAGGLGQFTGGQGFSIYQDSSKQVKLADIAVGGAPQTLQQIADAINNQAIVGGFPVLGGQPLSQYLTASVQTDGTGQKLVLTSNNAGSAGNFYIDDRDVTGLDNDGTVLPHVASTAYNTAIGANLSVFTPNNDVQSIDIYSKNGSPFVNHGSFANDGNENYTFDVGGTWNIGSSPITLNNVTSLDDIVAEINTYRNLSGLSAQVVAVTGGFVVRVSSAGSPLNYTPDSTINILQTGTATVAQVRPTSGVDSTFTLDGNTYNAGGNLTLANPARGISSVTISEQTPLTRFAVTQDTDSLTNAINTLVTAINDAQQYIAQQKLPGAPLSRGSSVILRQMQNFVNQFTLGSTNNMSMTQLGIDWINYNPTEGQRANGMVPAKYLSVNATTLQNIMASNFSAVQGFFAGSLSVGVASPNGSTISVNAMTNMLNVPAGFNLTITGNGAGVGPGNITIQDNTGVGLDWVSTGGNNGTISGRAGTIYDGLYLNYTFGGANLANFNAVDNIDNITLYNGVGWTISKSVDTYTSQYGQLNQTLKRMERRVADTYDKQTSKIEKQRNKALFVAKLRLDESKRKQQELERFLNKGTAEAA